MNTLELKGSILELIANIQDVNVLFKIKQLLDQSAKSNNEAPRSPVWLTDEQIADLENALEEIKNPNNLVPHEEHMQKFRTWSK